MLSKCGNYSFWKCAVIKQCIFPLNLFCYEIMCKQLHWTETSGGGGICANRPALLFTIKPNDSSLPHNVLGPSDEDYFSLNFHQMFKTPVSQNAIPLIYSKGARRVRPLNCVLAVFFCSCVIRGWFFCGRRCLEVRSFWGSGNGPVSRCRILEILFLNGRFMETKKVVVCKI